MDEHNSSFKMWSWCADMLLKVFNTVEVPWGFVPGYHDYEVDENNSEDNMFENVKKMNRMIVAKAN